MGGSVFRRPTASFWRRRRGDGGVRAGVLRDEIGVGAQSVAGPFDLYDDGVVEQPVEQRGGDDGIAEDLAPFREAAVGGECPASALVGQIGAFREGRISGSS
jgi:hypothetical protein